MNSNSTDICLKCKRPLEEGGGCYTFCEGKGFIPIPTEEKPQNIQETIAHYGAEDAIHL